MKSAVAQVLMLVVLAVGVFVCAWPLAAQNEEPKRPVPLTGERLASMIEGLGYEPKTSKDAQGRTTCTFPLQVGSWEFQGTMELATDGTVLWLSTGLQKLPEGDPVPAQQLLKLLKENEKDTKFFSVGVTSNIIKLSQPIPNHDITPAVLRRNLEAYKNRIAQTEELWNPKKWAKP